MHHEQHVDLVLGALVIRARLGFCFTRPPNAVLSDTMISQTQEFHNFAGDGCLFTVFFTFTLAALRLSPLSLCALESSFTRTMSARCWFMYVYYIYICICRQQGSKCIWGSPRWWSLTVTWRNQGASRFASPFLTFFSFEFAWHITLSCLPWSFPLHKQKRLMS